MVSSEHTVRGCDVIPIGAHIQEVFAVIGSAVCPGTLPYPEWGQGGNWVGMDCILISVGCLCAV